MNRALVVDDEKLIVKGIKFALEQDDFEVECAYDGLEAFALAKENSYDIILLDIMLPGMDGFEVCKQIRSFSNVPVIMLTAKGEDNDKIYGLDCGADDYITKPFNILEVKARIKAILRRGGRQNENGFKLNKELRMAVIDGNSIKLTSKEFELLELLYSSPIKVFSSEKLLNTVWKYDNPEDDRTVDVHIRRLREKIEPDSKDPKYVVTKWGEGYYFKA